MKKKLISNVVTIGFLVLFVWYGATNQGTLAQLKNVALASLVLVAFGKIVIILANGLFTQWTAEIFTKKFSFAHSIYITILSAIGNFFGPLLGGASIRAVYLKKQHGLSYSKFTATLMGYYLILFITNSLLAIVSVALLPHTKQTNFILGVFAAWLIVLVALTFMRLPKREKLRFVEKRKVGRFIVRTLYEIEEGWSILVRDKTILLKMTFLAVMVLVASYFISFVEFKALDIGVNFAALGLYTALVATSLLVSFTPGAIGIREAMLAVVGLTIGVSNAQIIQIAVIDRGVHFVLLGALFLLTRHSKFRRDLLAANHTENIRKLSD